MDNNIKVPGLKLRSDWKSPKQQFKEWLKDPEVLKILIDAINRRIKTFSCGHTGNSDLCLLCDFNSKLKTAQRVQVGEGDDYKIEQLID